MGTGEGFALEMDRARAMGGCVEEPRGRGGRAGVFFSSSPGTDAGRGWWREKATAPQQMDFAGGGWNTYTARKAMGAGGDGFCFSRWRR